MLDLLLINATYVLYRLAVTAHIIKFLNKYVHYYVAVLVAAQVSFAYDNGLFALLFNAQALPHLGDILLADALYTGRVVAAWFIIKQLWDWLENYYLSVFIGAELTFVVDYFIFGTIY